MDHLRRLFGRNKIIHEDFSQNTIPKTSKVLAFASKYYILPYEFDNLTQLLKPRSARQRLFFFAGVPVALVNLAFVFWRVANALIALVQSGYKAQLMASFNLLLVNVGIVFIVFVFQAKLVMNLDLKMQLFNQIILFRKHMVAQERMVLKDFKTVNVLLSIPILRITGMILTCIFQPNKSFFLYSLLPLEWKSPATHLAQVIFTSLYALESYFVAGLMFICIYYIPLDALGLVLRKRFSTIQELKPAFFVHYRSLNLLVNSFNNYGSSILPYVKTYLTLTGILSAYSCIRFLNLVPLQSYIRLPIPLFPIYLALKHFLPLAAAPRMISVKLKSRLMYYMHNNIRDEDSIVKWKKLKLISMEIRSMYPLQIKVGPYFVVRKFTAVTIFSLIFTQTVACLIYF